MDRKGKTRIEGALAWVLILGVSAALLFMFVGNPFTGDAASTTGTGTKASTVSNIPSGCTEPPQTDGTNTLLVKARNPLASNAEYLDNTFRFYSDGSEVASSVTGDASGSFVTGNVPPCEEGIIYAMSSTSLNGGQMAYSSAKATTSYELLITNSSRLSVFIRDTTRSNIGTGATSTAFSANTTDQALGSGGTIEGDLDFTANETTSGAFGCDEEDNPKCGVIFSIDIQDLSVIGKEDVSLSSKTAGYVLEKVKCEDFQGIVENNNADVCYKGPQIANQDGQVNLGYRIHAGKGAPAAGDNVIVYGDDLNYARDTDGTVKVMAYDSSTTDVGESQVQAFFSIS